MNEKKRRKPDMKRIVGILYRTIGKLVPGAYSSKNI